MVWRLGILHKHIEQEIAVEPQAKYQLAIVLEQTLIYFDQHEGLTKLFFMQIGYGDAEATEQLSNVRQNYRNILRGILMRGIEQGQFASHSPAERELMLNSIIGTLNWTMYETLVVQGEAIAPKQLTAQLMQMFERGLGG